METAPVQNTPQWSARRVVLVTLVVASILVLFSLFYQFSNIIFIFLISIVLSIWIRPVVIRMSRFGIPRPSGVIIVYLLGLSLIALLAIFTLPLLMDQATEISRELPSYYENFRSALILSPNRILSMIASQLPSEFRIFTTTVAGGAGNPSSPVANPIYYVGIIARGAFVLTSILILGFYWTLESERSIRSMLLWVPMNHRDQIRDFIADAEDKVGRFIIGQSILCLSIGGMALLVYLLLGLPYALVLAMIAAIMEAVPIIGPALGAIPAILVAFSFDPTKVIWVILASALIQGLENYLLVPRIMKRSVGVNPLLVLLIIAAFTSLFGLAGAILSIPTAAVIQLSINRFIIKPAEGDIPMSTGRGQVSLLRYETQHLTQDMRKQLRQKDPADKSTDDTVDSLEAIAQDLDQLLAETEQKLSEN